MTCPLVWALLVLAIPAAADPVCASRDAMMEQLADGYGEHVVAVGLDRRGMMIEVWASPGGTWTVTLTSPQMIACIVAAGSDWTAAPVLPAGTLN